MTRSTRSAARRYTRGAGSFTTPRGAQTLALHAGANDTALSLMEARSDTVCVLDPDSTWRRVFKAPLALVRAPSLDLIDDATAFAGIWDGNVHAMAEWTDCESGHSVTVEGGAASDARTSDSVLVLRDRYHHSIAPARTFEWGGPAKRSPTMQLQHAFEADSVVGGRDRATCAHGKQR